MAIKFGEIFLYSHNPEKLFHFLSHLLNIQAHEYSENKIRFSYHDVDFVIRPCESKNLSRTSYFSLVASSYEEIDDLKRNIEFYYYKEASKKFSITEIEGGIEFTDPDGRRWSVLVGIDSMHTIPKMNSNSLDVRNF